MSAETNKVPDSFGERLVDFDDRLHATANDAEMLADIQDGITRLLAATGGSESEIRRVLQERYDAGQLRKETFQLVKSMLDRYVSDAAPNRSKVATPAPVAPPVPEADDGDDAFSSTTVIPGDVLADKSGDSRVQVGSVLRDRFVLQKKVSGGSMGVVYKALDRRLAEAGSQDHWVAIKVLSPELAENAKALRALQQEAAKGRCLVHPNIVRFIDLDRDDELYFLVMEWLEGRTLADLLDSKDSSVIDHDAAFRITRQIGDALDYAHRCGIVHADIKPGNIMIMPNGDAKLFDFGVARVRQQHSDPAFSSGVLSAMTPAYSSMQVLTGEEPVAADDVFSLGCLLYRLIAGYRVFGPRNAAEAAEAGMQPQRLKALNDSQWRALHKALSYSRVTRFGSVREFIEALNQHYEEPFRVEEPDHFTMSEQSSGTGKGLLAIVVLLALVGTAGYQMGYLTPLLEQFNAMTSDPASVNINEPAVVPDEDNSAVGQDAPVDAPSAAAEPVVDEADTAGPAVEESLERGSATVETQVADSPGPLVGPDPMLVDFSKLPPASLVVPFSMSGNTLSRADLTVREDGGNAIIDFVRDGNLAVPLTLRLEEVGFSGNRSPWAAGQYALSNAGVVQFPAGQERGRVTLFMASDPLREADQQSTLRLRNIEYADSELALVTVTLEDDDQRAFEANLPVDTVAFAASQVSIRETDPAVQIDLVRFNPSDSPLVVRFSVDDITATEGSDYFGPGGSSVTFGPGQRAARILIPLVQDAAVEGDEAFAVQITDQAASIGRDVFRRIVVMIRDDEPQPR